MIVFVILIFILCSPFMTDISQTAIGIFKWLGSEQVHWTKLHIERGNINYGTASRDENERFPIMTYKAKVHYMGFAHNTGALEIAKMQKHHPQTKHTNIQLLECYAWNYSWCLSMRSCCCCVWSSFVSDAQLPNCGRQLWLLGFLSCAGHVLVHAWVVDNLLLCQVEQDQTLDRQPPWRSLRQVKLRGDFRTGNEVFRWNSLEKAWGNVTSGRTK